MCKLYVLTHPVGAPCASDRRRVAPHTRSEEAKMAELHYMEMGWSGSGWMDPLPMENTPGPSSSSTPSYDDFSESSGGSRTRPARPRKKASRKSTSARKSAKKSSSRRGTKKAAKRGAR